MVNTVMPVRRRACGCSSDLEPRSSLARASNDCSLELGRHSLMTWTSLPAEGLNDSSTLAHLLSRIRTFAFEASWLQSHLHEASRACHEPSTSEVVVTVLQTAFVQWCRASHVHRFTISLSHDCHATMPVLLLPLSAPFPPLPLVKPSST